VARLLVQQCFRQNTSLEGLHTEGKISQDEMRRLMIDSVDNVFTFLSLPDEVVAAFPEPDWQLPKINRPLLEAWVRLASMIRKRKIK
jgi:hypothetical protein